MDRPSKPAPLYRKVNTLARRNWHRTGGDYRHLRNTKAEKNSEATQGTMHGKVRRGLDYTPLWRFLLSKVGHDWDSVHSEAVRRLDRPDPIFRMVARTAEEMVPFFGGHENDYYSKLYVDSDNRLAMVDPHFSNEMLRPPCPCCTYTFNGKTLVNRYDPSRPDGNLGLASSM